MDENQQLETDGVTSPVHTSNNENVTRTEHAKEQTGHVQGGQPKKRVSSLTTAKSGAALCCLALAVAVGLWFSSGHVFKDRLLSAMDLELHNGDSGSPAYLAILGEVYDVSLGKRFYGKGGPYAHFVGKDATKAFVTGNWRQDLTDDVTGFTAEQCASLVSWRDFYRNQKAYKQVGRVVGNFYDENGEARPALKVVEELAAQAKTHDELRAEWEKQWPGCSMRWSEARGGAVWCDDDMYPRKVFTQMPNGQPMERCACFKEMGWNDVRKVYPGCTPDAHECQTTPPGPASSH